MSAGAYSRVYHGIIDDPRFATVMEDDAAGWTWVKLLIIAEQAWPASAYLPVWVKRRPLAVLVAAGIVEPAGETFRIHGLDPERQRRSDHGRDAVNVRWSNARSNAPSNTQGNAQSNTQSILDEHRQDEHRQDEHTREPDDAALAYFDVMGHAPSGRALGWLNEMATSSGDPPLCMALRSTPCDPPRTYLSRVQLALTTVTPAPPKPAGPTTEAEFMAAQVHIPDPLTAEIMASYGTKPA